MMNDIIRFFQNVADDCELVCFNQDLVGFFTSIPVPRIVAAVDWMLQQFMLKYDTDPAKYTFSVSLREKDSKLRVWKGKSRSAGTRMYQIWFQDILPIVRIACDSSYFTVLGRVFAQQRGAAIGNQISPVLASISVAHLAYAIEMIMTKDRWRFRLPSSLHSGFRSTSLFQSRAANIRKYVWPLSRRNFQLVQLESIFRSIYGP